MERIKLPPELDIGSLHLSAEGKEWSEAWDLYRISNGLQDKDDSLQIATIEGILGTKARRVLKTLPNVPADITERTVRGILTALETYCVPRKNTIYERYVFRTTSQEDRAVDVFVTDLRRRAEYCEFGDSLIRDQIMVGINDHKLRERLLRETDLSLEKAIKLCRITEQSKKQSKVFDAPTGQTSSVETVKQTSPTVETEETEDWRMIVKCKFCGSAHNRGNCPAYGVTCYQCHGRNHCTRCCLKSKTNIEQRRVRHLEVESNEGNGALEGLSIEAIQGSSRRNIRSDLLVNGIRITIKLDTGAECNIMSMHLASELSARIVPTSMLLKSFGGHQLDTVGKCVLPARVNGAKDSIPLEYCHQG